jgi:hypothetical protein
MIAVVELGVCSSTRRFVDKAGREKPDTAEGGLLARLAGALACLCGHAKYLVALVVEENGSRDMVALQ